MTRPNVLIQEGEFNDMLLHIIVTGNGVWKVLRKSFTIKTRVIFREGVKTTEEKKTANKQNLGRWVLDSLRTMCSPELLEILDQFLPYNGEV